MDIFKDLITCGICSKRMKDPRCLPCLHAFCYSCILGVNKKDLSQTDCLMCPTCQVIHESVPVEQLPHDFKVIKIIEKIEQREQMENRMCFEHHKPLELFCYSTTCLTPICFKCSITTHQNHDIAETKEHFETLRKLLAENESAAVRTLANLSTLNDRSMKLKTLGAKLKKIIDNRVKESVVAEKNKLTQSESPEGVKLQELYRLQVNLMQIKEKITNDSFADCRNPIELRQAHRMVTKVISELNETCDSALSVVKSKQISNNDLLMFQVIVQCLLRDNKSQLSPPASMGLTSMPSEQSLPGSIPGGGGFFTPVKNSSEPGGGGGGDRDSVASGGHGSGDDFMGSMLSLGGGGSAKNSPNKFTGGSFQTPQVIIRFQCVNPAFDKFAEPKDCALLGEDFVVIDHRNEWIKSFDVGIGRYIGTNKKGLVCMPVGIHTINNEIMLLVEENIGHSCDLFFVDKDLSEKELFKPELPSFELIHDVCTSPIGQIYLITKTRGVVYEQQVSGGGAGSLSLANRAPGRSWNGAVGGQGVAPWRETKFNNLFSTGFPVLSMAASSTGLLAFGNANDGAIYTYSVDGSLRWKFPARDNVGFKCLKQINFDIAGNLLAVDNSQQQVQIIGPDGQMIRILHGRGLQFARPTCVIPRGDNQVIIMSEFGSIVIIESYL